MSEGEEPDKEEGEEDKDERERLESIAKELEAEARSIFNCKEEIFDFTKQRATDCKQNAKVVLPGAMGVEDEAKLEVLRAEWNNCYDKFVKEHCNAKGDQESNLSKP